MASPLAPAQEAALNYSTPATIRRYDKYEVEAAFTTESKTPGDDTESSSPFISTVQDVSLPDQENPSPSKTRHSRVLSGTALSPLKILSGSRKSSFDAGSESMGPPPARSPRKVSPEKRFPVKVSAARESAQQAAQSRAVSLEDAMRDNEGLKRAIDIFEDEQSALDEGQGRDGAAATVNVDFAPSDDEDAAVPDDTMTSTFSTFSAVPSMTMFAKLGQSPTKLSNFGSLHSKDRRGPSPSRSPYQTNADDSGNTTSLLMDFTEQFRLQQRSPANRGNLPSSMTTPNVGATPSRPFTNLIDFDIPPMPTPRSVPSVTPRELESLKSNFLSEISSLKASLSGRDAEVQSLKTAVADAEKRVGESMEQVREERSSREQLASEKEDWQKRGRDMESVLRKVKDEVMLSQKEREELEQKLDESEKRREAAEMLHQEAESKMAGMRAGKDDNSSPEKSKSPGSASNRDVEVAVERVARELHALYKSKHETKVAALKKSYEARWEKKIRELESRIEDLGEDNERLRVGRDATMTRVDPGSAAEVEERKAQAVKDSAMITGLNADVQRLEAVISTVKSDNEDLRGRLEKERVEKGELVQLAEEMMSMQSFVGAQQQQHQQQQQQQQQKQQQQAHAQHQERQEAAAKTPRAAPDGARMSLSRSGLKAPSSSLRVPHERNKSSGGLPRPGGVARSGIMSSIERMGSYRGRAAE